MVTATHSFRTPPRVNVNSGAKIEAKDVAQVALRGVHREFAGWLLAFFVGIRELVMSSLIRPTRINLLAPWIMNQFEQGHRAEAMAMTLIGVGTSTAVLVLIRWWQGRSTSVR